MKKYWGKIFLGLRLRNGGLYLWEDRVRVGFVLFCIVVEGRIRINRC